MTVATKLTFKGYVDDSWQLASIVGDSRQNAMLPLQNSLWGSVV